jgi:hypothetical protein
MSFCFDYDFQKWTILSLGLTAATLIVGLVILVGEANGFDDVLKMIQDYCFSHADDITAGKNPVNELISSGLISPYYNGRDCKNITDTLRNEEIAKQYADNMKKFFDPQN